MKTTTTILFALALAGCSSTVSIRDRETDGGEEESSVSAADGEAEDVGPGGSAGSSALGHAGGGGRSGAVSAEAGSAGGSGAPGEDGGGAAPDGATPEEDAGGDAESAPEGSVADGGGVDALWDPVAVGCPEPFAECHPSQGGGTTITDGKIAAGCCRNYCQAGGDWGDGAGCVRLVKCADDPTYPNCISGSASCGDGGKCIGWARYPNPETCVLDKPGYNDGFCAYCQVLPGTCGGTSQIVGDCTEGSSVPPACTPRAAFPGTWCCP